MSANNSGLDGRPLTFGDLEWNLGVYLGLIGLTFLEYGTVRQISGNHLIFKNILQFATAFITWWLIGYGFALGDTDSRFIGQDQFGGEDWLFEASNRPPSYFGLIGVFVIFIINGVLSEKTNYIAYQVFTFCVIVFIWPVIVSWMWGNKGFLRTELDSPVKDNGFTITIYVFAGAFAMIGAAFTGRRVGRYSNPSRAFAIEQPVFYYLGAVLTIIGIFTLNNDYVSGNNFLSQGAFANTWIAGSASSLVSLKLLTLFSIDITSHFKAVYQGFIAGMVLISSAGNCNAWEAALFGMMSGLIFSLGVKFSNWIQYDDVLNVIPTFFLPGLAGGVLPGFIDNAYGVFWGGTDGELLAVKVVAVVVVTAWSTFWAVVVFGLLDAFDLLVLSQEIQSFGLNKTIITQKGFELQHISTSHNGDSNSRA